ncbi:class I adenylate-forming enzyme family protein [Arthrobacter sp. StoSoilB20]|uniref:class I adenylate-forming enzyme family protein n=1 Tax=Arthrobacter sp. StoSoilB20 TaxID=2830995 RepID=UPI0031FF22D2
MGDVGYLQGGNLHILGRTSDIIITAGNNVYPHQVELAPSSVPGVENAVAVGMPDDLFGSRVVAGIVPSYGGLSATALGSALEDVLTASASPAKYYVLGELPLTDRGKISRPILADWIKNNDPRVRPLT